MDVNDFGSVKLPIESTKEAPQSAKARVPADDTTAPSKAEEITVELTENNQVQTSDLRNRANQIINVVNVTSNATEDIQKLVESIGGIVEQAQEPELAEARRAILEKEANQLVAEIKSKAQTTESGGIRPLLGDTVRFDVEQRFGDALEIILPDSAKEAFGLGQIKLSMKDSIIDTITRVEQAKIQFEKLRTKVEEATSSVKKAVDTFEVALQNGEAAKSSIRSLDEALGLASTTHKQIGKNHQQALGSFSKLDLGSTDLLR